MILCICVMAALVVIPSGPARGDEGETAQEYCGTNIPPDEAIGFVPLPEGDVFCPLIADPKAAYSYVSYVRGTSSSPLGTDLGSVGVADRFGLARWGGPRPGEGFQISLEGGVFAQFDLNTPSYDLINADYLVGIPLTYRWKMLSARARLYHQSSHLGDEFVLRSRIPRENFAFQSAEGILSLDAGPLRLYAGGEYQFNATPSEVETKLLHGGVELRQRAHALRLGQVASVRLVAAGDVKLVEDLDWEAAVSVRGGFEISRARESLHASRRWSLLAHFYDGPSPYGQFFRSNVRYYGAGLHFAL
jgi:Protein of unknown function (DUF1207)